MRLVLITCRCASMESARSTLVRVAMPYRGSIVATPNQSRNGSTHWVIPMASDFACIICHTVSGDRKVETISRWTREKGVRYARGMENLSVLGVSGGRQVCPGARCANKASISITCGTARSARVSHSGFTTTLAGRRPRGMSLAKARPFRPPGWVVRRAGSQTQHPRAHTCLALGPRGTPRWVAFPSAAR